MDTRKRQQTAVDPTVASALVIDDNHKLSTMARYNLRSCGLDFLGSREPGAIVSTLRSLSPTLIILCVRASVHRNVGHCLRIRQSFDGPLLVIGHIPSDEYESQLLNSGADCVLENTSTDRIFKAHVAALLRRCVRRPPSPEPPGARDDAPPRDRLVISPDSRQVTIDGKCIALTVAEFDLLSILASRQGKVVSRDELCQTLLRREYDGLDRCIDLRMSRLRKKLEDNARLPRLIKSVRSEGYMLVKQ